MEDKMHLKSETAYFMMLQEGEEARVYLKDDVDAVIAEKDAEIARLKARKTPDIDDAVALAVYSGKSLPNELVYRKAAVDALLLKRLVDPGFTKKEPVVDTREAVAELKDEYCTHCVICGKPWGAGALHMQHRVTFHGRFVTNLYTCLDCNAKISRGEI